MRNLLFPLCVRIQSWESREAENERKIRIPGLGFGILVGPSAFFRFCKLKFKMIDFEFVCGRQFIFDVGVCY
jgi:hypothetical protein